MTAGAPAIALEPAARSVEARSLVDDLLAEPRAFTLLQAARVLTSAGITVRYRPSLHLAFPAAEVESIAQLSDGANRICEITTPVLGVYGPGSPLPTYVTEFLLHQDDAGRARAFIDRFNHRILALFQLACAKYRPIASDDARDRFRRRLDQLLGLSPCSGVDFLPYAGTLLAQPASAAALESILIDRVSPIAVRVEQCVPRWTALPVSDGALLGSSRLGVDSVAGDAVWSRATSFRIVLGPLEADGLRRFSPGGAGAREIAEIVERLNPNGLEWDLELVVHGPAMPIAALGAECRLGWSTRIEGAASADYRIVCSAPARPAA